MKSYTLAILAAFIISSIVAFGFPKDIFSFMVELNRKISCETIPICLLRDSTFTFLISYSSEITFLMNTKC